MSYTQQHFELLTNFLFYFIIVVVLQHLFNKFYKYRDITKWLPTVYGLPFLGIIYKFCPVHKMLSVLGSYFDDLKTSTFFTWFANKPVIVTVDPDIIKRVLNSEEFLNKATMLYETVDNALPNGIITSKFSKWKHNRKLMNPFLFAPNVQHFIPNFNKAAQFISRHFATLNEHQEHDIFAFLKHAVLQMAVGTTMGTVLADGEVLDETLAYNFNKMQEKIIIGITLSFLKLDFLIRTSNYYKTMDFLKSYVKNLINRKLNSEIKNEDAVFLNRAIKLQQDGLFELDDTITESYTMIIGSFETVSTTLYSIIIMLAIHQDVQEKLYQDLLKVIGNSETNIEPEHFQQLPYLNRVIDETLRLTPPIPLIGRESLESCKLTDDIVLPREFQILIPIFHLHRRKDLWGPDADSFNPDNFLPENIAMRHPYAYIPYSKGVRNCIGWRYAQTSLKILLLGLLRNYKFSTTFKYKDLVVFDQISLRFLNEPKIQLRKRAVATD